MRGVIVKVNNSEVGRRINSIRKDMGINQEDFGKRIYDAHKSLVSKWEKGQSLPNNERLKKIAEIGGISVNELLHGDFESYCYGIFDAVNAAEGYDSDRAYKEITDPGNKRAFYAKVFDYVKEYKYDYEDYDRICNLYKNSIANEVHGADYTNEGSFNYLQHELEKIKWGLRDYFYTPVVMNDTSDAVPGDEVTIAWGGIPREDADFELYEKQEELITQTKIKLSDLEIDYKENEQ